MLQLNAIQKRNSSGNSCMLEFNDRVINNFSFIYSFVMNQCAINQNKKKEKYKNRLYLCFECFLCTNQIYFIILFYKSDAIPKPHFWCAVHFSANNAGYLVCLQARACSWMCCIYIQCTMHIKHRLSISKYKHFITHAFKHLVSLEINNMRYLLQPSTSSLLFFRFNFCVCSFWPPSIGTCWRINCILSINRLWFYDYARLIRYMKLAFYFVFCNFSDFPSILRSYVAIHLKCIQRFDAIDCFRNG